MSMTKGKPRMAALVEAQTRRQDILDYLQAHGRTLLVTLCDAMPPSAVVEPARHRRNVSGTLQVMKRRGEVGCEGPHHMPEWFALVATTVSAETMYNAIKTQREAEQSKRNAEAAQARSKPWLTRNVGGLLYVGGKLQDKPASAAAGGQGNLRARTTVNCFQLF